MSGLAPWVPGPRHIAMHEMSIAINVVGLLKEEMEKHPGQALVGVKLTIGELSGVEIESLRFSLEVVFAEEHWEDVELDIQKAALKALCKECGREFEPEPADFRCKECGSGNVEIKAGESLTIDSITLL